VEGRGGGKSKGSPYLVYSVIDGKKGGGFFPSAGRRRGGGGGKGGVFVGFLLAQGKGRGETLLSFSKEKKIKNAGVISL